LIDSSYRLVLNAIIDFLPSPLEVPALEAEDEKAKPVKITVDPSAPFAALAFKALLVISWIGFSNCLLFSYIVLEVVHDAKKGMLVYFRVYSGTVNTGDKLINSRTGEAIRIMKLVRVAADDLEELKEALAAPLRRNAMFL